MNFKFVHNNINVKDLDASLAFYHEALGFEVKDSIKPESGEFIIVYLGNEHSPHLLELTWLKDWDRAYNLGDNEFHMALEVDDYEGALKKHKEMDVVCYENPSMGIYFIADPDGYWVEILPAK